jgi:hypothetical protein
MIYNNKRLFYFFLFVVSCFTCDNLFASCNDFPLSWEDPEIPNIKGYNINYTFGYSVIIPDGLIAKSDSYEQNPVQHHGFGIFLSKEPKGYIWVSGDFNSPEYKSVNEIADSYVEFTKKDQVRIISSNRNKIKVNGLPALRLIIKYSCQDKIMLEDYFIVFHVKRQIYYTISLISEEVIYEKNKKILENIASSWQLQPIP